MFGEASVPGCDIRLFDKDIHEDYDSTYPESWFLNKIKAYGGNPYEHLIDLAELAQIDGVIKGILLHQGETNAGDVQWPSYVKKVYRDMLADLSLNAESVPLLAGEVLSAEGNCCSSMNTIINGLPDTIPTAHVISSGGCTAMDFAHFDSEGYRLLGKRYALKMLSLLGYDSLYSAIDWIHEVDGYALHQNSPNPFTGSTSIGFEIANPTYVSLKVINMQGAEVAELAGKEFPPGKHTVEFNLDKLSPGNYLYAIEADEFSATRKMVVQAE